MLSRFERGRLLIVVCVVAVAFLVLLLPPWQATAIRTTTRYAAVSGVAPAMLVDTVVWTLAFEPLWAPPRATLDGQQMRILATRSFHGDTTARGELRRRTEVFEGRYHTPEVLRTGGELWRDSVLSVAGIPSLSSYDVTFRLDQGSIAARLVMVILIAFVIDLRRRGSTPSRAWRERRHVERSRRR